MVFSPSWDHSAAINTGAVTYALLGADQPGRFLGQSTRSERRLARSVVSARFTTDNALVVGTTQNRVLLLQVDAHPPVFNSVPPDIVVNGAPGAAAAVVNYAIPTVSAHRSTPPVRCTPLPGTSFPVGLTTVTCSATDSAGVSVTTSFTVTVVATPAPPAPDYIPLTPARLTDTRAGQATIDFRYAGIGLRAAGTTLELAVAGRGGVPVDAAAVALNVTSADSFQAGFVTVYPCGAPRPTASSVNYSTGVVTANAVITQVGVDGKVCLFTSGTTAMVVDVNGYFPATTNLHTFNPAHVLETRPGEKTADGLQQGGGLREAATITPVQIVGRVPFRPTLWRSSST